MGHKWVINNGNPSRVTFQGPSNKILDLIKPEGEIDLKELGLNERQIEALRLMVNEGRRFTINEYSKMFNVSDKTTKRDMRKLVEGLNNKDRSGEGCIL